MAERQLLGDVVSQSVYFSGTLFICDGTQMLFSDVWLTLHRNSIWIRKQLLVDVTFVLSFISPLQVAQHVSGNHVPIFRS